MTSVYITADNVVNASEWISSTLNDCKYQIQLDCTNPFSDKYNFVFESKNDAVIVALKWGNRYSAYNAV
jgi:hypothetical protein